MLHNHAYDLHVVVTIENLASCRSYFLASLLLKPACSHDSLQKSSAVQARRMDSDVLSRRMNGKQLEVGSPYCPSFLDKALLDLTIRFSTSTDRARLRYVQQHVDEHYSYKCRSGQVNQNVTKTGRLIAGGPHECIASGQRHFGAT